MDLDKLKSINEITVAIISEQLGVETTKVFPESKLVADLSADSLDLVELIMKLEDEFTIQIPDEEAEEFETVKDIIDFLNSKLL